MVPNGSCRFIVCEGECCLHIPSFILERIAARKRDGEIRESNREHKKLSATGKGACHKGHDIQGGVHIQESLPFRGACTVYIYLLGNMHASTIKPLPTCKRMMICQYHSGEGVVLYYQM